MEPIVRKFDSLESAEQADAEYYRSLTPDERVNILLQMVAQVNGDPPPRFERVFRFLKLGEE